MPRQSRGPAPAPKRPMPAPQRAAPPPNSQSRQASTVAHPPQGAQAHAPPPAQQAPAQSSGGSGLFGQMASTAAGVAVGSSIGHAIGGFFGGGSSHAAAPAADNQVQSSAYDSNSAQHQSSGACATDVSNFRKCMDENQGSLTVCGWYLDQLKACQQAAGQY